MITINDVKPNKVLDSLLTNKRSIDYNKIA